jgi:hypothetical protein
VQREAGSTPTPRNAVEEIAMLNRTKPVITGRRSLPPVTLPQIQAAVAALGIEVPLDDIAEVRLDPASVEVTRYARTARGDLKLAGNAAAVLVLTAPVVRG